MFVLVMVMSLCDDGVADDDGVSDDEEDDNDDDDGCDDDNNDGDTYSNDDMLKIPIKLEEFDCTKSLIFCTLNSSIELLQLGYKKTDVVL